ncbi:MAG: hypothetical protein RLZZ210_224 [Pseudomonadota bacterium]|jgi:hypothetical protein
MAKITRTTTEYTRGKYVDLVTGQILENQLIPHQETEEITIPEENTTTPGVTNPDCNNL